MKKTLLICITLFAFIEAFSQSLAIEKQRVDSLLKSGTLNVSQTLQLRNNWLAFTANYNYPELPLNITTGEADFTDIMDLNNFNKQIIYQKCLEWSAINYFNILYKDPESGKIIAAGLMNLTHSAEYPSGFGKKESPTQTSVTYTMILTIKDNKIKFNITNIEYTFSNYSESSDEMTLSFDSLFPIVLKDKMQWKRYITVLNETRGKIFFKLKTSMSDYVKTYENDYKF